MRQILIFNDKALAKKLLAVLPEKGKRRKKRKKTRMTIAKLFVLNANKKFFFFTERLLSTISD